MFVSNKRTCTYPDRLPSTLGIQRLVSVLHDSILCLQTRHSINVASIHMDASPRHQSTIGGKHKCKVAALCGQMILIESHYGWFIMTAAILPGPNSLSSCSVSFEASLSMSALCVSPSLAAAFSSLTKFQLGPWNPYWHLEHKKELRAGTSGQMQWHHKRSTKQLQTAQ